MPQQVRIRRQGAVVYQTGQLVPFQLSRGMVYREIYLRMQAAIAVTTGSIVTALTAQQIAGGGIWNICKSIEILANGSDSLRRFSGEQLNALQPLWFNAPPKSQGWTPFVTSGTNLATIDTMLVLPYWQPKSLRPLDTALDARLLSQLQLNITWGSITDVISANYIPNTTGVYSFSTNPTLTVYSNESFDPSKAQSFAQYRNFQITDNSQFANGAVTNGKITLPVGQMYRGFLICCKSAVQTASGSAGYGLAADIAGAINGIRLKSGTLVYHDMDNIAVQESYRQRNGIYRSQDTAGVLIEFGGLQNANSQYNPDAYTMVDLCADGYMSEAIDTLGFSELYLEIDTNTAIAQMTVIPMQIIPIRASSSSSTGAPATS